MTSITLKHKKYNSSGNLAWEYNPLRNVISNETDSEGKTTKKLSDFDYDLDLDINHPVNIECQPSYDGSTNLILNDDLNPPRIVNSGFSVKEDNTFERISRNQNVHTNLYRENTLLSEIRLQRTSSKFLQVDLENVVSGGELKGGNYTFLFQYADDDKNKSRVVAESGVVSVFHGTIGIPYTNSGTLLNETTDKKIILKLTGVDGSFSRVYVSYKREYSDTKGIKMTEYVSLVRPFEITEEDPMYITIDGRGEEVPSSHEYLTTEYNTYSKVKTQTQNQNVLFFGNVENRHDDVEDLQKISLYIGVKTFLGNSVGMLDSRVFDGENIEYYSPHNIYYNLGYMPEEYYRLGVVYIYDDDSRSNVYNLRGCEFLGLNSWNIEDFSMKIDDSININKTFIAGGCNTKGVFRMPKANLQRNDGIHPLLLEFYIPEEVRKELQSRHIKGFFFVRQPRIPVFLMQALSLGISDYAYSPMLSYVDGNNTYMFSSSPINVDEDGKKMHIKRTDFEFEKYAAAAPKIHFRGLFSIDAILHPQMQSLLNGSSMKLKKVGTWNCIRNPKSKLLHIESAPDSADNYAVSRELIYVPQDTPYRSYKNYVFSTKVGSSSDILSLRSLEDRSDFKLNKYCVRGNFTPYIGVVTDSEEVEDTVEGNSIYNIYTSEYSSRASDINASIEVRGRDHSEFFAICDAKPLDGEGRISCARGDCFTCTSASKFQWNYLDHQAPLNDKVVKPTIVNEGAAASLFNSYSSIEAKAWTEINVSDVNAIDLGHLITYKYMSNFNCIRTQDFNNISEISMFGSPRSFYPLYKDVFGVAFKITDSTLVNEGLSSVKGLPQYYEAEQVPYVKKLFDTRIGYSNAYSAESFSNGYRAFARLNYVDIERTFGAIVKLIPYGADLFCVFEHGCGIIPVNQKALIATTSGQSVQLSGNSVLQSQVTVISQDYGSTWEDSIVITPNAIYGVDTFAKKIWKYTAKGFELLSDQIVQRFLNENITLSETDKSPVLALTNVKTHFNNFKGDVMFTFYDDNKCWNLCYNERIDRFVTRYSWSPLFSDNIQNSYVSIDKENIVPYALVADTITKKNGLRLVGSSSEYVFQYKKEEIPYLHEFQEDEDTVWSENTCRIRRAFRLHGFNDMYNAVEAKILSLSYPEWDYENNNINIVTLDGTDSNALYLPSGKREYTASYVNESGNVVHISGEKESAYATSIVGWGGTKKEDPKLPSGVCNESYRPEQLSDRDSGNEDMVDEVEISNFKAKYFNYAQATLGGDLDVEIKLNKFVSWIKLNLLVTPILYNLEEEKDGDDIDFGLRDSKVLGQPFEQTICLIADYDYIKSIATGADASSTPETMEEYSKYLEECNNILRIGLYTHGKAGIYDEISNVAADENSKIKPTFWYNKQEPFEFEFVVNSPSGLQKVFDNLVIISNNVEPNSLEFSIVGDSYDFNKAGIFKSQHTESKRKNGIVQENETMLEKLKREFGDALSTISEKFTNLFSNSKINYEAIITKDSVLNEYGLVVSEECRNVSNPAFGRRLGNIEYREDKWLVNISPIYFKKHKRVSADSTDTVTSGLQSAKLRDKWIKVRVKYRGDKLVVVSAIQTLMTLSYS